MYTIEININVNGLEPVKFSIPFECSSKEAEKLKKHLTVTLSKEISQFGKVLYDNKVSESKSIIAN